MGRVSSGDDGLEGEGQRAALSDRAQQRREAPRARRGRGRGPRVGGDVRVTKRDLGAEIPERIHDAPDGDAGEGQPRRHLQARQVAGVVLARAIDADGGATVDRYRCHPTVPVGAGPVGREVRDERAYRDGGEARLHTEEDPPLGALTILELPRAKRDEAHRIGALLHAPHEDLAYVAVALLLALLEARLDVPQLLPLLAHDGVEELDHPGRIE